jgi:hypothetical protein
MSSAFERAKPHRPGYVPEKCCSAKPVRGVPITGEVHAAIMPAWPAEQAWLGSSQGALGPQTATAVETSRLRAPPSGRPRTQLHAWPTTKRQLGVKGGRFKSCQSDRSTHHQGLVKPWFALVESSEA